LRIHCGIGIAFAEPARGVAHRVVGLAKAILTVPLLALLALFALLAALTFFATLTFLAALALLALGHAAPGEFFLQFLEPVAQALLVLLQIAHVLVAALLSARPVAA